MAELVTGNLDGLRNADISVLERLARRRVAPPALITAELAETLAELSAQHHRQIGVIVDRRGNIVHVVVGDASGLFLPDLGRSRAGSSRLRGLRLLHTHVRGEGLSNDDLTDLTLLRLDAVVAITISGQGRPDWLHIAGVDPLGPPGRPWRILPPEPAMRPHTQLDELIAPAEHVLQRVGAPTEHQKAPRALLVAASFGRDDYPRARHQELLELCRTAGVEVVDTVTQHRTSPDPKTLVGRGKLDEILLRTMQVGADVIIFDPNLSPTQARTIAILTELKILDRTMLILDIFARHANSRDGKLQVELAQLRYALPRLAEKNTMMSRLVGGIGGRGPGETKLEISRRRARERIHTLANELLDLARHRRLRRKARRGGGLPTIAICGYTNAGKSTLLNALTNSEVIAANKLFATLDPVSRRLRFPTEREVILTDTVGFIRDLPTELLEAFSATLEEMHDADVLLHVVDGADSDATQQIDTVVALLATLGLSRIPRILVWNKCDRIAAPAASALVRQWGGYAISATDASTLGPLLLAMEHSLRRIPTRHVFAVP